jgi:hypothetical protein
MVHVQSIFEKNSSKVVKRTKVKTCWEGKQAYRLASGTKSVQFSDCERWLRMMTVNDDCEWWLWTMTVKMTVC